MGPSVGVECELEALLGCLGNSVVSLLWTWKENNTDCELCFESLRKITRARTILFDLQIIYAQKKCGNKVSGSWNINFLLWLFNWNCLNDFQD